MGNVHAIPIRKEVRGKRGTNLDIAHRLMGDIKSSLDSLVAENKTSLIDLRQVPHMTAETYQYLREQLGVGEVSAAVATDLTVEITETAVPGVWWVAHRDVDGETVTEIIEITQVPSILRASRGEIRAGAAQLAARLAGYRALTSDANYAVTSNPRQAAVEEVEP